MMTAETYVHRVLDQLPRCTPRRDQIAAELRGHITERTSSGQSEPDVIRQLGDPLTLAESYLSSVPLVSASFGRRATAKMIDALAILALAIPATWLLWVALPSELAPFALFAGLVGTSALFALYTIVAESRVGRTLGKNAVGLRVVRESGARISLGQSFVRQLPMFLEVFAIDALFALFTERHQRAFELLSKTRVVLAEKEASN